MESKHVGEKVEGQTLGVWGKGTGAFSLPQGPPQPIGYD